MNKLLFVTLSLFIPSTINCMDIHDAAREGNLVRVQEFLDAGTSVDARDYNQNTPLHLAAFGGHENVALLLLGHGAEVDARDYNQNTPLHGAALSGRGNVALFLLGHRAEVDARNEAQHTPLHLAAFGGHENVALLLLGHGAAVDARDYNQNTPLHGAALCGHENVALLLLGHRAAVDARDHNQNTPLHFAALNGRENVAQVLRDWSYYQQFKDRQQKEGLIVFLLAQNPRVGKESPARVLPPELYQYIARFVVAVWHNNTIDQIHDIAEQERERERNHPDTNILHRLLVIAYRLFGY